MKSYKILSILQLLTMFLVSCNKHDISLPSQNKEISNRKLGSWFWTKGVDVNSGEKYFNFALDNNIDEIFLSDHSLGELSDSITELASKNDVDVYYLLGDVGYMNNIDDSKKEVERFLEYNANNPKHKFKGIHFDVEPVQDETFKTDRNNCMKRLVNLAYTMKSLYKDVIFQYDIPFWMDDEITFNNTKKKAHQFMIDYADKVYIMSYRDSATLTLSVAKEECDYAKSLSKSLALSFETSYSEESEKITYYEEGREYLLSEMKKVRDELPSNFSLAIHHLKSFYELK